MAQTGYTPIKLYYSTTATAVPTSGNLADGELALNIADMKLYAKNSSGSVTLLASSASSGTVTDVSVVSANGLAGTVANSTSTPAITLSTSVTGVLKGNGTAISAAVSGTDYAPATSGTSILKGSGSGGFSNAVAGTDYAAPTSGTSILYGNGSGGFSNVTIGANLTFSGGTLSVDGAGAPTITNYTDQSANITLTNAAANTLIDITLANDIKVTMPDATTLVSAKNFTIKNSDTTYGVMVHDSAGTYLFAIPPGTSMSFWAKDVTTSAGVWTSNQEPQDYLGFNTLYAPKINTTYRTQSSSVAKSALSSTQFVYAVQAAGSTIELKVGTFNGSTITYGNSATIGFGTTAYYFSICTLSSTSGVVAHNYNDSLCATAFTVSGTEITLGETVLLDEVFDAFPLYGVDVCMLSSTTAAVVGARGSVGAYVAHITVSGLNITNDGIDVHADAGISSTSINIIALDSAKVVVSYSYSNTIYCVVGTYSSGAWSFGTIYSNTSQTWDQAELSTAALSSSSFAITAKDGGNGVYAFAATVSSFAITFGSSVSIASGSNYAPNGECSLVALSPTLCMTVFGNSSNYYMYGRLFAVSGTTVTATGSIVTLNSADYVSNYGTMMQSIGLQSPAVASPSATSVISYGTKNNQFLIVNASTISGSTITPVVNQAPFDFSFGQTTNLSNETWDSFNDTYFLGANFVVTSNGTGYTLKAFLYSAGDTGVTLEDTLSLGNLTSATVVGYASFKAISSTQGVLTFANSSGSWSACVITRSGATISAGSITTINGSATGIAFTTVVAINSTQVFACVRSSGISSQQIQMALLTVSGSSISVTDSTSFTPLGGVSPTGVRNYSYGPNRVAMVITYTDGGISRNQAYTVDLNSNAIVMTSDSNNYSTIGEYSTYGIAGKTNKKGFLFAINHNQSSANPSNRSLRFGYFAYAGLRGTPSEAMFYASSTTYISAAQLWGGIIQTSETTGLFFGYVNRFVTYKYTFNSSTPNAYPASYEYQPQMVINQLTTSSAGGIIGLDMAEPSTEGRYSSRPVVIAAIFESNSGVGFGKNMINNTRMGRLYSKGALQ